MKCFFSAIVLICFMSIGCNKSSSPNTTEPIIVGPFLPDSFIVPDDYPTIQQAIDAITKPYGSVFVGPGIYHENIDFHGVPVWVRSYNGPEDTIIDGGQAASVVTFKNNEEFSGLIGFTIQNGSAQDGGGICILGASPVLKDNVISNNRAFGCGGGVYVQSGAPRFENNIITNNISNQNGGGLMINNASPQISNALILNNNSSLGAGIYCCESGMPILNNCTITKNKALMDGGAFYIGSGAAPEVRDSIIADNLAQQGTGVFINDLEASLDIHHSCLKGGMNEVEIITGSINWGAGMLTADPEFTVGSQGFYFLSQIAAGQAIESPCVDRGSMYSDQVGLDKLWTRTDQYPDEHIVDMGFHYGSDINVRLQADEYEISSSTGGVVNFLLNGKKNIASVNGKKINAFRKYILFASSSGTLPGTPLPGNEVIMPLNWDSITNLVVQLANTPLLKDFMGTLDANGNAFAQLNIGPISNFPSLDLYFAFALSLPWDYVSNPVQVRIQP